MRRSAWILLLFGLAHGLGVRKNPVKIEVETEQEKSLKAAVSTEKEKPVKAEVKPQKSVEPPGSNPIHYISPDDQVAFVAAPADEPMVVMERRTDLEDAEVLLPPDENKEEAEKKEEIKEKTEKDLLADEIKRDRKQLARERRKAAKKHRKVDPKAVLSDFAPQTRIVDGALADEKMFVHYDDHVIGPYEYERILSMIMQDGRACPSGIDPQALYEAVLNQQYGQYQCPHGYCYGYPPQSATSVGSTVASSFSYSFAPEPSTSATNTWSTTAYPPSAKNTIVFDTTRDTAFHRTNASTYEIGALIPLSVNGTGLLSGVQFAESFRCAINLLNSNSRVLKNTLLTYLIQDTGVLPNVAVNQAYLLERRDLSMVIGPYDYDSLPPVANLYNNVSLPFISYGASGVQYSNGTVYPTFFRTIPSDLSTARAMAETMSLFGWGFVAAIFTTDSYGQSGRTALLQQIGRQRLKVTCVNQIDPGSTRGLANFADCMAQSEASVVVLWMNAENAANVMAFLYQNATNSRLTFMAPDRWALVNRPRAFNDTIPATNYTFPISYVEGTLGFVPMIGSLSLYKACMSAVSPENTNYPAFNQVWQREFRCIINASDTVPLCPQDYGLREHNCRCTGQESLNDLPVDPKVNYILDSVNVFATTLDKMIYNCGPSFQSGPFCNRSIIASSDILFAIPQLSFRGLTGVIAFNQTRPDRRRTFLDLYQYNAEMIPYQVGFWNLTGPFYSKSRLHFKTYPAIPISRLKPEDTVFDSSFWTALVAVMAGLGIFCCIYFIVFYTVFRKTRVVRRANLLFIYSILLGIIAVFLSMILWVFTQDTVICTTKTLLGMIGIGFIMGPIVAKVQRYFRVLLNYGYIEPTMTTAEFLLWWSIPVLIDTGLAVAYCVVKGFPTAQITQSVVDNTYVYISCVPGTKEFGVQIVAIFLIFNGLLMIVCAIFLFFSRPLITPYNEGTFLFLVCLDFIVLLALLIPLYYTVGDRRGSALQTFLLRSLGQLFAMYLTLGLLFVPKMIYTIRGVKQDEAQHRDPNEYGGAATTTAGPTRTSMTAATTEAPGATTAAAGATSGEMITERKYQANYAEMSTEGSEDEDYDEGGPPGGTRIDSASREDDSGRPGFVSQNISRTEATGTNETGLTGSRFTKGSYTDATSTYNTRDSMQSE